MALKFKKLSQDADGQAVLEYLILVSTVVAAYLMVAQGLAKIGLMQVLMRPIANDFAMAYKYGNVKAKGYDEGTPQNHPRIDDHGPGDFRIFINPKGAG